MDLTLLFDREHEVLLVLFGKVVTDAVVAAAHEQIRRFLAAHGPCRGVCDFSGAESVELSTNFVRDLAAKPPIFPPGQLHVLVAPRPALFGMARMFQLLQEGLGSQTEVVHTRQEAFRLLEIPELAFSPAELE